MVSEDVIHTVETYNQAYPHDLVTGDRLAEALLAVPGGDDLGDEAALDLLIAHRWWLCHPALHSCTTYGEPVRLYPAGDAIIDWVALSQVADEHTVQPDRLAMLQCAVSIAGHGHWSMNAMTEPLDDSDFALVCQALAHARGWDLQRRSITLTGVVNRSSELTTDAVDLARRVRLAVLQHRGIPDSTWRLHDRRRVALVLGDDDYVTRTGSSRREVLRDLIDDGVCDPDSVQEWLRAVRREAGLR